MNHSPEEDVKLLSKIAQKDEAALSLLYDRYAQVLLSFAYRILHSLEESEEVISDVFVQVWRNAPNYNPARAKVDTWLFMLTRSRAIDRLRQLTRQERTLLSAQELPMVSESLEQDLIIQDRSQQVIKALAQIPYEQRQVLELSYFGGMSHTEIAIKLDLPLGTIKTRIRLGITKLRQLLNPQEI